MTDLRQQIEQAMSSEIQSQSTEPQDVATSETNETATAEPVEVINAPNSYTKEAKDWFATLPHENQKYLADREKQFEQGLSRARNQYSWVDKLYTDRKDALTGEGYENAQAYLNDLVMISDALHKDPAATINLLKQNFGIDDSSQDNALQKQVTALSQMISEQQKYLDSERQAKTAQEYNEFVNAKDDKGALKHTYLEEVRPEMIALLKAGLANNLEDAYNQAVWRVESVRDKIIAEKAGATVQEKATVAEKSKKAAFDPSSKSEPAPRELTLREELERNYKKFME
ncbi:MAG: hypothetical protein IJS26_05510 [Alphaproteobacteria bacterium]|nr:hypothetical protein [Alphaproteobacteria bacterium]